MIAYYKVKRLTDKSKHIKIPVLFYLFISLQSNILLTRKISI